MVAGKSCDTNADQEIKYFAEKDLRNIMYYKINICQHLMWYCEEIASLLGHTIHKASQTFSKQLSFSLLPFQLFTLSSDPKKQNNSDWKETVVEPPAQNLCLTSLQVRCDPLVQSSRYIFINLDFHYSEPSEMQFQE